MNSNYFIADTHFGHANIIKYCNRPFSSVDEHDECLIKNWNSVVKQGDNVYHLGDYGLLPENRALEIRRRLNGTIFFIEGNHDKTAAKLRNSLGMFGWYDKVRSVRAEGFEYFLSHYSHRVWNKSHHGVVHLYGHSHNTLPDDPKAHSMDVGIDATAARLSNLPSGRTPDLGTTKADDYRPISVAEVQKFMAKKEWQPIDHHGRVDA